MFKKSEDFKELFAQLADGLSLEEKKRLLDEEVQKIHNSTRTLFKNQRLSYLHRDCRLKSKLYYKWHLYSYCSKVHWATLVIFIIFLIFIPFNFLFSSISIPSESGMTVTFEVKPAVGVEIVSVNLPEGPIFANSEYFGQVVIRVRSNIGWSLFVSKDDELKSASGIIPSKDFTFTSSTSSDSDSDIFTVDSPTQFSTFPFEVASSNKGTSQEGALVTLNYRIKTDWGVKPDIYTCYHKFTMVQNEGL